MISVSENILLDYIQYRSLSSCNNIKTFDFSTLYTTIPHSKPKDKLRELVQLCFIKKNYCKLNGIDAINKITKPRII
jgi:hypothetical protein